MTSSKSSGDGRWAKKLVCEAPKQTKKPTEVDQLAQRHATAAIKALVAVMKDDSASPAARISAAAALLQWGFGKTAAASKAKLPNDPASGKAEYVIRLSWGAPAVGEDAATD